MNRSASLFLLAPTTLLALLLGSILHAGPASARATDSDTYERTVVRKTNAARTVRALAPLRTSNSCLDRYAETQAARMARAKQMYHQDLGTVLRACRLRMVGENVAYGYTSGAAVTQAWLQSPGHRANILKRGYREIGVGAVLGSNGVWYAAQVFGTRL